ncbi:MAG TPA: hydantoinase B/oxoprolinase family protein [Micromonosporaceae bacterium]
MTLDPVTLSVLRGALESVATEMGTVLVRSAYSSNIKERRDCSAALFDPRGRMVAQAEHIPVHLGAMPESVAAVIARDPRPGDVFALNDPYTGGTHLTDVTLVSPVTVGDRPIGYAVTRAHHSDVGGMAPGSMPGDSRDLWQEGLVIPPVRLVREGRLDEDVFAILLANSRTPRLRRGDYRAQLAANEVAGRRLSELVERRGRDTVFAAYDEILAYAERRTREALRALPDGVYRARGELEGDGVRDDDVPIEVAVTVAGDTMTVDFTGTADAVDGNVNCPLAVTRSACYFALRVLLPDDVPANAGAYAPLEIVAPEGSLVHAQPPHAVVAGNVETSQRLADTVLAALAEVADVPAAGQGTMNNVVVGGRGWTYYETVAGGQGASSRGPGPSGVHVGMTNTLNTPIEALELEYPMRVERYELAEGTGGTGRYRGGDGVIRSIRVLEAATVSLLTDRRRHPPSGARGGDPGAVGHNLLGDGADVEELPSKTTRQLTPGEVVTVTTPGGGGWGSTVDGPGEVAHRA